MPGIENSTLSDAGYFCIPLHLEFRSGLQSIYLETGLFYYDSLGRSGAALSLGLLMAPHGGEFLEASPHCPTRCQMGTSASPAPGEQQALQRRYAWLIRRQLPYTHHWPVLCSIPAGPGADLPNYLSAQQGPSGNGCLGPRTLACLFDSSACVILHSWCCSLETFWRQ